MRTEILYIDADGRTDLEAKFQPHKRIAQAAHMSKDSKRNWCPRAMRTRMNVSGVAKWQRVPLGSICAFRIHWCSTCRLVETRRSWRGVHSCAVYGGLVFSPTRRLLQPPLEYRRHLVITDSFFSFFLFQPEFFMSDYLHKHTVSSFPLLCFHKELNSQRVIRVNNKTTIL